jgi:hypothetical protein
MFWSPVFMSSGQPVQSQTDLQAVFKGIGFWHGQVLTYIQTILFIGLLVLVGITCQHASTQFKHRNGEVFLWKNKGIANDVIWLRGSEKQLNDIGISYDDQVFVGYAAAPNTSLVYLNRNGKVFNHEEMTRDSANLAYWYERIQPDYVIIPASNHASFQKDQSAFYNRLVLFAKRPNLYIYKPI